MPVFHLVKLLTVGRASINFIQVKAVILHHNFSQVKKYIVVKLNVKVIYFKKVIQVNITE